jgi:hypothetical protein
VHIETVPEEIIEKLREFNNTKIIIKSGDLTNETCKPRMWRFEAIDDPEVEIMMSRDTDTRFTIREKMAVDEWLSSNKVFHIMRDHPCHDYNIMAGMFGTKKIEKIPNWKRLIDNYFSTNLCFYDQLFLRDAIYPHIKDNSIIHATFHQFEPNCRRFPIKYCDEYRFVGEYVYEDESRDNETVQSLKHIVDEFRKKWALRNSS